MDSNQILPDAQRVSQLFVEAPMGLHNLLRTQLMGTEEVGLPRRWVFPARILNEVAAILPRFVVSLMQTGS